MHAENLVVKECFFDAVLLSAAAPIAQPALCNNQRGPVSASFSDSVQIDWILQKRKKMLLLLDLVLQKVDIFNFILIYFFVKRSLAWSKLFNFY